MTNTTRTVTVALIATLWLAGIGQTAFAGQAADDSPAMARVRSSNPAVAAMIRAATEQSATFKGLIEAINASDGLVYVESGTCRGHGVPACFLHRVTVAGPNRILRVIVETQKDDRDLMGFIGHELRHALEVLSDPAVRSDAAIYFLYRRTATSGASDGRFETEAAIAAGAAVRAEVRHAQARLVVR